MNRILKAILRWIEWQMKPAGEKAHILQMQYDPAYRAWYYNTMNARRERWRTYYKEMTGDYPPQS
jgi:uncharacterized Fe-S radical SAM superfamily protein PflX